MSEAAFALRDVVRERGGVRVLDIVTWLDPGCAAALMVVAMAVSARQRPGLTRAFADAVVPRPPR
jgi:hypothetical protein